MGCDSGRCHARYLQVEPVPTWEGVGGDEALPHPHPWDLSWKEGIFERGCLPWPGASSPTVQRTLQVAASSLSRSVVLTDELGILVLAIPSASPLPDLGLSFLIGKREIS